MFLPFYILYIYFHLICIYWYFCFVCKTTRFHMRYSLCRYSSKHYTGSPTQQHNICSRCTQPSNSIWCYKLQRFNNSTVSAQLSCRVWLLYNRFELLNLSYWRDMRLSCWLTLSSKLTFFFSLFCDVIGQYCSWTTNVFTEWHFISTNRIYSGHGE